MERFALTMADVVMFPGEEVMEIYSKGLMVDARVTVEASPPIRRMLGHFSNRNLLVDPSSKTPFVVLGIFGLVGRNGFLLYLAGECYLLSCRRRLLIQSNLFSFVDITRICSNFYFTISQNELFINISTSQGN